MTRLEREEPADWPQDPPQAAIVRVDELVRAQEEMGMARVAHARIGGGIRFGIERIRSARRTLEVRGDGVRVRDLQRDGFERGRRPVERALLRGAAAAGEREGCGGQE